MSKTKIFDGQPPNEGEASTQTGAVAVARVVSVGTRASRPGAAPAQVVNPSHTQMIGSFVVAEPLALHKSNALAMQRAAAEDWAAAAPLGSQTVVVASAAELAVALPGATLAPASRQRGSHVREKSRARTDSTTRMIASFRGLRRSRTTSLRAGIVGLAAALALGGFYLGKPAPPVITPTAKAAAPYPPARAAAPAEPQLVAAVEVAPRAAPSADESATSEGSASERQAIDALISGNRKLAIDHYRALAARHPRQRAYATAADILSRRSTRTQ